MAVREFQGVIHNTWDDPVIRTADDVDGGQWQDPWFPSKVPGAGRIATSQEGEWRSESDGIATGTSGWARWAARVVDPFETPPEHFEWIQVNWSVPFLGTPDVTYGTSRNDPASSDAFTTIDTRPPTLEIVATNINNDDIPNDTATQVAAYFFTLPASWLVHLFPSIAKMRVNFVVRRRAGTQSTPLTLPTGLPGPEQLAMGAFRNRMQTGTAMGFLGGFPNFYESTAGRDHFGGTILVRSAGAAFRDVPLKDLGNVSLSSFPDRIRAANVWAVRQVLPKATGVTASGAPVFEHPFVGAFPTFFHADHGAGVVCGTIALTPEAAEARNVPQSQLGNFSADNYAARFRATQDYAAKNGFIGGFPTFIDERGIVGSTVSGGGQHSEMLYGIVLLKRDHSVLGRTDKFAVKRDLLLFRDPA